MKLKLFSTVDEFRRAAKESDAPLADAHIRAGFDTTVKAKEGADRTLTFTISTASVDRMGDTVAVAGWKLDSYRKNPVVLWAHDATSLPVAKATHVWMEGEKLMADAEFTPPGMAKFNDVIFDMYVQGFLSATSVGFMPLKYAFTDDPQRRYGIDFLEQELFEFSAVPVPANPEALIEGKAAGIDIAPMLDWCENVLLRSAAGDLDDRIARIADGVLSKGASPSLAAWAERVIVAAGKSIVTPERVERIERAAKQQRLANKRARDLDLVRLRG